MTKRDKMEQEANAFAVLLLIPEKFLLPEIQKGLNLADDTDMKKLCAMFGVSSSAMTFRLHLLNKKYPKGMPDETR